MTKSEKAKILNLGLLVAGCKTIPELAAVHQSVFGNYRWALECYTVYKKDGLVEQVGPQRFKITPKGRRVLRAA